MRIHKSRLAAIALAPAFLLMTPALAMAANDPGSASSGQGYHDTQTSTGRDGVTTTTTDSCMGADGNASYQRTTQTVTPSGRTSRTMGSGDNSCDNTDAVASPSQAGQNEQAGQNNNTPANPISDRNAPLVQVNGAPTGR